MWEIKGSVSTDDRRNQEGKLQNNCFCKQKDKFVKNIDAERQTDILHLSSCQQIY